jgi:hypothetical protein
MPKKYSGACWDCKHWKKNVEDTPCKSCLESDQTAPGFEVKIGTRQKKLDKSIKRKATRRDWLKDIRGKWPGDESIKVLVKELKSGRKKLVKDIKSAKKEFKAGRTKKMTADFFNKKNIKACNKALARNAFKRIAGSWRGY